MRAETFTTAARDALYLTIGLVTGWLALCVWVTGLSVSLSLAVCIIGLPVILLTALAFRWTAELGRQSAVLVLDRRIPARYRDHRGERFLARLGSTLGDPQTWRDLAWLVLHSVIGFGFGCAAVTLVTTVLGVAVLPFWYWAPPEGAELGIWTVDSLPEAFAAMPLAIPLGFLTIGLLRVMALGEAWLAAALLGPAPARLPVPGGLLAIHIAFTALVGFFLTLLWGLTGFGAFWPGWVWLGLLAVLGLHAGLRYARAHWMGRQRWLAGDAAVCGVAAWVVLGAWVLAGNSYFWPVWPLLGLSLVLGTHGLWAWRAPAGRERELTERVDVLTRTRRGALDVQAAELRRIERDLHDGAQARLVALSMQLGRAEERLEDQPEIAELVRRARGEASAAIAELRDLARGIAPPVLADRGLEAAVEALGRRSAIPVTVDVRLEHRPPPVVETAAYFVVAEAITNAAKHAGNWGSDRSRGNAAVLVTIAREGDALVVEVADGGAGGADPAGGGLTGLRHRVEALDGMLMIASPPGEGTTIRAELPCAS